ncbi:putative metal-dependent hydrolase [Fulvivirga imtechensis AK7]|uniref:Putative metal-dependent hydrolase n=1 Tax=Fulvivirga imtechensis AK7 TaxID=1237149 RepID=L8JXB6_9BACT|nr:MBL fold metallo-hydrolase [Fulvivirga imtechensis]ELR72823.1 putative metal-dependent hydrolase [Fulvivirga imtechensis AK7]
MKNICTCLLVFLCFDAYSQDFERDVIETTKGPLTITFIGHGSLMMEYLGDIIHIDPSSREAEYAELPDADLVLITHHHGDHCDPIAFEPIEKKNTTTFLTALAKEKLGKGTIVNNGETATYKDINIEAIPAYNLVHKRDNGEFFHPKGCCNSYVLTIGGKRIFIGGDTENTPEMKALKNIDIAFLPMNLPYTMTPEMVADAAKAFRPKILYPYHYGKTDTSIIVDLLKNEKDIEIRIRKMS